MASFESALREFFESYTTRFNEALAGVADLAEIAAQYTSTFFAAGPQGVQAGQNNEEFLHAMEQGFGFYRSIGTQRMSLQRVGVTPIDLSHAMAKVSYRASYLRPSDQHPIDLDFEVTYLLEHSDRWRVFGFVAGDEQALFREHGLTV